MAPHYWLILGIVLLIGEIFTMDFSLSCFGVACLLAALASWIGINVYFQLAIVAVTIFVLLFSLRPLMLKYLNRKGEGFKSNIDAMVGKKIKVTQIEGNKCLAKHDGDVWELNSKDDLKVGDEVIVSKIDGIILFVKKEEK